MPKTILPKLIEELKIKTKLTISVHVVPKSQKNQLIDSGIDEHGQTLLKLKIRGVPEKGQVNEELIDYLAELLDLPKSHIQILSGHTSRHKIILLNS